MRCAQFEERLQRLLDQRELPSEDSQLNRHARRCPECRETLAACCRMIDGLNLLELRVPDEDFSLRVVGRTQVGRPSPATRRRFAGALAGIAAGLALTLLLPFSWREDRTESATVPAPVIAGVPLTTEVAATGPRAGAVDRSADAWTKARLDQQQPLALLRNWTASWSDRTWNPVDGLAGGLTPITTPLSVAVEEIRRTIPLGRVDHPTTSSADSVRDSSCQNAPPVA
jgi:anti-sigma factor RsiW